MKTWRFLPMACLGLSCAVAHGEIAGVHVTTTNMSGETVSAIDVGNPFVLRVLVEDLREEAYGVFSAYVDVRYDQDLVSLDEASMIHGADFGGFGNGDFATIGLIDEAGSLANNPPPLQPFASGARQLLFSVVGTAKDVGTVTFSVGPADSLPLHETTVYGLPFAVTSNDVRYDTGELMIVPEPSATVLVVIPVVLLLRLRPGRK